MYRCVVSMFVVVGFEEVVDRDVPMCGVYVCRGGMDRVVERE